MTDDLLFLEHDVTLVNHNGVTVQTKDRQWINMLLIQGWEIKANVDDSRSVQAKERA